MKLEQHLFDYELELLSSISDCWRNKPDHIVKEFQNWGDEFNIQFSIKLNKMPSTELTNVFHFTANGDYENYGDRIPALNIYKDGYFLVCSAVNNEDHCTDIDFVVGKQYEMAIIQWRMRNLTYMYEIIVDGTHRLKMENTQPKSFPNVKLFASDPWTPSFSPSLGSLCNVKIEAFKTSGRHLSTVRGFYCTLNL